MTRCLGALVGLDAPRHVVAVVDLEVAHRVALAEHPLLVGEADVIVRAVADVVPDELGRPGPIALEADDELARVRVAREQSGREGGAREGQESES